MKKVNRVRNKPYTTGDVSRICKVACRTVSKWIDGGLLKGWKLPGSQDRRVEPRDLLAFCRANSITPPEELLARGEDPRLLVIGGTRSLLDAVEGALREDEDAFSGRPIDLATDLFTAGAEIRPYHDVVVVDGSLGAAETRQVLSAIHQRLPDAQVVVVLPEDFQPEAVTQLPVTVLHHPVAPLQLVLAIQPKEFKQ